MRAAEALAISALAVALATVAGVVLRPDADPWLLVAALAVVGVLALSASLAGDLTWGRLLQLATGVHRVHHVRWAFGWVFTPLGVGRFGRRGWRRVCAFDYHDCTRTGRS